VFIEKAWVDVMRADPGKEGGQSRLKFKPDIGRTASVFSAALTSRA